MLAFFESSCVIDGPRPESVGADYFLAVRNVGARWSDSNHIAHDLQGTVRGDPAILRPGKS